MTFLDLFNNLSLGAVPSTNRTTCVMDAVLAQEGHTP